MWKIQAPYHTPCLCLVLPSFLYESAPFVLEPVPYCSIWLSTPGIFKSSPGKSWSLMLTLFCHGEIEFHSKSACFWEIELLRWFWYTVMLGSTLKQPVSVQSSCLPGQNDLFYALLWCLEFHQYRLLPRPFRVFLARLFFPASNPPGESLKSTLAGTWDGLIRNQSLAETRGSLRLESKGDRRREASEAGL